MVIFLGGTRKIRVDLNMEFVQSENKKNKNKSELCMKKQRDLSGSLLRHARIVRKVGETLRWKQPPSPCGKWFVTVLSDVPALGYPTIMR